MTSAKQFFNEKRAKILVKNLKSRHFDAYYCATKEAALKQALELIPEESMVGWGGVMSAHEIGLIDALRGGNYRVIDRDVLPPEQRGEAAQKCFTADVFLTSANALSMDGEMVNIDGQGNRVAAIIYGPKTVLVIAGMNKVCDDLENAIVRARTVAAPMNQQRFASPNPCGVTGTCADCKTETCICNHIVITRHSRPVGRIKFILVGEDLGF